MSVPSFELPVPAAVTAESFLARVTGLIDWAALAPGMESVSNRVGEKLPLSTVKIELLKRWYELDDTAAEFTILDRLSFRGFVGFAGDGSSSDVEILNELRESVWSEQGELNALVSAVEEQLRLHGYTVRPGVI